MDRNVAVQDEVYAAVLTLRRAGFKVWRASAKHRLVFDQKEDTVTDGGLLYCAMRVQTGGYESLVTELKLFAMAA